MKVRVFSDATKLDEVWNEHGFDKKMDLAARAMQFVWHVLPSADTIDIKNIFRVTCSGSIHNYLKNAFEFLSMFNDIRWTKKGNSENMSKEVAAFAANFKPGHWCFLGPAAEKTWWIGNPSTPPRTGQCGIANG